MPPLLLLGRSRFAITTMHTSVVCTRARYTQPLIARAHSEKYYANSQSVAAPVMVFVSKAHVEMMLIGVSSVCTREKVTLLYAPSETTCECVLPR